jgi:hypothetical protein
VICIGSIDELEKLSGIRVTDLHREKCYLLFLGVKIKEIHTPVTVVLMTSPLSPRQDMVY